MRNWLLKKLLEWKKKHYAYQILSIELEIKFNHEDEDDVLIDKFNDYLNICKAIDTMIIDMEANNG